MNRFKQMGAALLALCLLTATGCGSPPDGGDTAPEPKAMGRYIEEDLPLPEKSGNPMSLHVESDGTLNYIGVNRDLITGEFIEMLHYRYTGGAWQAQDTAWMDEIQKETGKSSIPSAFTIDRQNAIYCILFDEDHWLHLYKIDQGKLTELDIPSWQEAYQDPEDGMYGTPRGGEENDNPPKNGNSLYPHALEILEDGTILIDYMRNGILLYRPDGTLLRKIAPGARVCAVSGNKIGVAEYDDTITFYSLETGERESTPAGTPGVDVIDLAPGGDGSFYLCGSDGISRITAAGTIWETLVDGALSSLSVPAYSILDFTPDTENGFYVALGNMSNETAKLTHIVYSADTPSMPDVELTLYTLHDSPVIRQAIGVFRQKHPEALIDLRVGMDDADAATAGDVIRSLNTELLAGRGPDILVLDGLPADSYIEKGVLEDLTDILPGGLLAGPDRAFTKDGRVYAAPGRFTLPIMAGHSTLLKQIQSYADLAGDFPGEPPLFAADAPKELLQTLSLSSSPAWQKEDGSLDRGKLREFLQTAKALYDRYNNDGEGELWGVSVTATNSNENTGYEVPYNALKYGVGAARLSMVNIVNTDSLLQQLYQTDNGEWHYNSAAPLAGQAERAFCPVAATGVCASSQKKDLAKEFVQTLLSPEVQDFIFNDGLPVREESLKKDINARLQEQQKVLSTLAKTDGSPHRGTLPKAPRMEDGFDIMSLFANLKTPVNPDATLLQTVLTEGEKCLRGTQTVDQAVDQIVSQTALYLQEQQ